MWLHVLLLDGCTAVFVLLLARQVFVAGVGDSAAYLSRRAPNGRYGWSKFLADNFTDRCFVSVTLGIYFLLHFLRVCILP